MGRAVRSGVLQVAFHVGMQRATSDEIGRDVIFDALGLLQPDNLLAPGYWLGQVNPSSQIQVPLPKASEAARAELINREREEAAEQPTVTAKEKADGGGFGPAVSKLQGRQRRLRALYADDSIEVNSSGNLASVYDDDPEAGSSTSSRGNVLAAQHLMGRCSDISAWVDGHGPGR